MHFLVASADRVAGRCTSSLQHRIDHATSLAERGGPPAETGPFLPVPSAAPIMKMDLHDLETVVPLERARVTRPPSDLDGCTATTSERAPIISALPCRAAVSSKRYRRPIGAVGMWCAKKGYLPDPLIIYGHQHHAVQVRSMAVVTPGHLWYMYLRPKT